ncbi:type IV pilus modification protein PilV [Thalassotalea aquiviva]|uniref:type IV pilus modification protein PilV n=1 Tax=Thalassotalea aquiviva TaxID=3242415 RepID=UPI00352A9C60
MRIKSNQMGLTFIEVLVAVFILTSGIFGAIGMQIAAQKSNFDAKERSIASALAQDIVESMRANKSEQSSLDIYQGTYGTGLITQPSKRCHSPSSSCNSNEVARNDVYEWEQKLMGSDIYEGTVLKGGLINGRGCISRNQNQIKVVVSWQSRTEINDGGANTGGSDCGTANAGRRQVLLDTFIY